MNKYRKLAWTLQFQRQGAEMQLRRPALFILICILLSPNSSGFATGCWEAVGQITVLSRNEKKVFVEFDGGRQEFFTTTRGRKQMEYHGGRSFSEFDQKVISARGKLLDAGTSEGYIVEDYRALGVDAVGVDIALPEKLKGKPHYIEADIRKMNMFKENTFDDTICSFNVFHYPLSETFRKETLAELIRVTKSGGIILLVGVTTERDFAKLENNSALKRMEDYANHLAGAFENDVELIRIENRGEGHAISFRVRKTNQN